MSGTDRPPREDSQAPADGTPVGQHQGAASATPSSDPRAQAAPPLQAPAAPIRWRRSLQWRLVLLFVLMALGTTSVFLLGARQWVAVGWHQYARPLTSDYVDGLVERIGSPPDVARAQALTQRLPLAIRIRGPLVNWESVSVSPGGDSPWARLDRPGRFGPDDQGPGRLLLRQSADGHAIAFALFSNEPTPVRRHWLALTTLLLIVGVAFWAVRRLFRPLADIQAGVARFGAGRFDTPIPARRPDEWGVLSGQINRMADNLHRMLEGQRGLLLAISHELRSPLTRARLNAELVADGPEKQALLRDLAAMRDLIADLLESERLSSGAAQLQLERTDVAALVRDEVAQALARARAAGATPTPPQWQLADPAPIAQVDPVRLRLLVRNLVENAWRHAPGAPLTIALTMAPSIGPTAAADAPTVSHDPRAGGLRLVVTDGGPGLPAQALAQLAQPFFRPDAARSRATGGVGLGLYLCRLVAESHGGRLDFADAAPGLQVQVWLPGSAAP